MFPHPSDARYYIAGQTNIIFQAHGPFHSPYSGVNSFLGRGEYKTSLVGTLFLGYQLRKNPGSSTDIILNVESAGGRGISEALGLAGFTNLDVVRNPNLGSKPYLSRYQVHQVIGLSKHIVEGSRTTFSLASQVPERRIDLRIGKLSIPDLLDINSIGSDSHLQFMNWTVDNNGAYDYAADTRGYTIGAIAEYDDKLFSGRYLLAFMPTVANGINLDYAIHRSSAQNVELELRKAPSASSAATPRTPASTPREPPAPTLNRAATASSASSATSITPTWAFTAQPTTPFSTAPTPNLTSPGTRQTAPSNTASASTSSRRSPRPPPLQPLRLERGPARILRLHRGRPDPGPRRRLLRPLLEPALRQAGPGLRHQRHQARPPALPRPRRLRLPARRRTSPLRPRRHRRKLLQSPHLEGHLLRPRRPVPRAPRLQPGSRPRPRRIRPHARRLLTRSAISRNPRAASPNRFARAKRLSRIHLHSLTCSPSSQKP